MHSVLPVPSPFFMVLYLLSYRSESWSRQRDLDPRIVRLQLTVLDRFTMSTFKTGGNAPGSNVPSHLFARQRNDTTLHVLEQRKPECQRSPIQRKTPRPACAGRGVFGFTHFGSSAYDPSPDPTALFSSRYRHECNNAHAVAA